jgi:organic hydroperoxide reductase OsmC/OhrA
MMKVLQSYTVGDLFKNDIMTGVHQVVNKKERHFTFEARLKWTAQDKSSVLTAGEEKPIRVGPPPEFGGDGKHWSPEHLFLGAVSSCFATTYMVLARKYEVEVAALECNVTGEIEFLEGSFRFTIIHIFPKVFIKDESLKDKARLTLDKTQHYCIVANSINAEKIYHGEVIVEPTPEFHQTNGNRRI